MKCTTLEKLSVIQNSSADRSIKGSRPSVNKKSRFQGITGSTTMFNYSPKYYKRTTNHTSTVTNTSNSQVLKSLDAQLLEVIRANDIGFTRVKNTKDVLKHPNFSQVLSCVDRTSR